MAIKPGNKRVVLTIKEDLLSGFEARADRTGQTLSAVISLALLEYIEQKNALESLEKMMNVYEANAELVKPGDKVDKP